MVDSAIKGPKAATSTMANSAFGDSVVMTWRTNPLSVCIRSVSVTRIREERVNDQKLAADARRCTVDVTSQPSAGATTGHQRWQRRPNDGRPARARGMDGEST